MTDRHPQWEARASAVIAESMARPYKYGSWDCIMFPLAVAQAVTGKDYARGHRGKYNTALSAARYLKSIGFDSPEAALDSVFEEKPVGFAQRFDIVLADDGIPAVCMGAFALSVGQDGNTEGLVRVPRSQWVKAWRVG